MGDDVAGDFGFGGEGGGCELDELRVVEFSEGFVGDFSFFCGGGCGEGLVGGEVVLSVLGPGDGSFGLCPAWVGFLSLRIVEADVSFAEGHVDGWELALFGPAAAVVAFEEGVKEASLQLDFFVVVEGEVVAAGDEAEVLEVAACVQVALDIAAQVEEDAAPVCDGEEGDLDVGQVELLRGVVLVVAELVAHVVDGLVLTVLLQLFRAQIAFDGIRAPVRCFATRLAVLV